MKFLTSTAIILAALGAVSAHAADLGARPYTKAPAYVAPSYNWGGFYVGAHVGYGWADTNADQYNLAGVFQGGGTGNADGVLGGGQIGYNWVFAPNWLLGVEADISGADIRGSSSGTIPGQGSSTVSSKIDYLGTARGRIGYFSNNVLLYATGGAAWAGTKATREITAVANPAAAALVGQAPSSSSNPVGWTAGGGLEWGFASNWSAKVEYLYTEFDTSSTFTYVFPTNVADRRFESNTHLHTVKFGVNYHFGGPVVAKY
ncbi:outer membrane beta-barrel protein [Bradyrhizobium sp. NP1]|uniref:outer membrane protein n=1 Tax=Bradyrhizobium sp. NP1 TaxID=3049772 RepID=UPI0025A55C72|nr:outer membrane beta-barrel protein [Bradyrhizobium sp. NP1]WJR79677.1 outer membrane beta-barrel protein [Bradyrhizobium sp. NP1]